MNDLNRTKTRQEPPKPPAKNSLTGSFLGAAIFCTKNEISIV